MLRKSRVNQMRVVLWILAAFNPFLTVNRFTINSVLVTLFVVLPAGPTTTRTLAQAPHRECDALIEQINDSVNKVAQIGEDIGEAERSLSQVGRDSEHGKSIQKSIESMKASLQKMKLTIDTLLDKLCECCGKNSDKAGASHKQCDALIEQINDSVNRFAQIGEDIGQAER